MSKELELARKAIDLSETLMARNIELQSKIELHKKLALELLSHLEQVTSPIHYKRYRNIERAIKEC